MNGVLVISTRNGACLYAARWAPNFGLPGDFGGASGVDAGKNDDDAGNSASSPAAMHLAGMLFALAVDAASLTNDVDPHGGGDDDFTKPPDASSSSSANELITRWSAGDCALHLRTDRTLGIMCVVSASVSALGDDIPARLADTTLRAFIAKHEPRLATGAVLGLEFDADLLSILARTPRDIAVAMVSRIGLSSPWVYAACSDAISPGGPGRRLDAGDVANDAEIDFVLKKLPKKQPKRRGKMALPGRRSGISFREEDAGRASGSGGGCFNRRRTAPRAVSLVDVEDVGPCAILCELPSGRKSGTNAGPDGGHRSVIDATIALVHAAVSATPGLSTVELAMGDEGEGGDDGDLGVARVLTFRWEEFFLTTPLTAGDVERAKRGSGGAYLDSTNASVVRASLGEDAMRLGRVMRFVRSIGARLD